MHRSRILMTFIVGRDKTFTKRFAYLREKNKYNAKNKFYIPCYIHLLFGLTHQHVFKIE